MDDSNRDKQGAHKRGLVIALGVSLVGLVAVMQLTDTFSNTGIGEELFKDLCDSFFTVGVLFIFSGMLLLAAKNGTFNFFSYNGKELLSYILPTRMADQKRTPYHEYVLQKEESRKKWRAGYILMIGAAYCLAGVAFLALYSYFPY